LTVGTATGLPTWKTAVTANAWPILFRCHWSPRRVPGQPVEHFSPRLLVPIPREWTAPSPWAAGSGCSHSNRVFSIPDLEKRQPCMCRRGVAAGGAWNGSFGVPSYSRDLSARPAGWRPAESVAAIPGSGAYWMLGFFQMNRRTRFAREPCTPAAHRGFFQARQPGAALWEKRRDCRAVPTSWAWPARFPRGLRRRTRLAPRPVPWPAAAPVVVPSGAPVSLPFRVTRRAPTGGKPHLGPFLTLAQKFPSRERNGPGRPRGPSLYRAPPWSPPQVAGNCLWLPKKSGPEWRARSVGARPAAGAS